MMEMIVGRIGGLSLVSAPNAEFGLVLARKHDPDLIFLDINLPGIDGFEALKMLRAQTSPNATPVVAISAIATAADKDQGVSAGFADYVIKPIEVNDVIFVIKTQLAMP